MKTVLLIVGAAAVVTWLFVSLLPRPTHHAQPVQTVPVHHVKKHPDLENCGLYVEPRTYLCRWRGSYYGFIVHQGGWWQNIGEWRGGLAVPAPAP